MKRSNSTAFSVGCAALLPLLLLILMQAATTHATSDKKTFTRLPCLNWTGPDPNNQFYNGDTQCPLDSVLNWVIPKVIVGVVFIVLSLFLCLFCPLIFCARYICNCCGSYKQTPGNFCCGGDNWENEAEADKYEAYTEGEVKCSKYSTFFLAGLAVLIIILVYTGVAKLVNGVDDLRDGLSDGIKFFQDIISNVENTVTRTDGTSPLPSNAFSSLQDILNQMDRDLLHKTEEPRDQIRELGTIVGYSAFVPAAILGATVIAAMMNIRSCLPVVLVLLCFLFQLIYCFAGSALSLGNWVLIKPLCAEVNAAKDREPGVFQWYLVPQCDKSAPFRKLKDNIDDAERVAVSEACGQLGYICSAAPAWDFNNPNQLYVCDLTGCHCQGELDCSAGFTRLTDIVQSLTMKTGTPAATVCEAGAGCDNIQSCADHCIEPAKSYASDTLQSFQDATNLRNAYRKYVEPWLDCQALIDKMNDVCFVTTCEFLPQGLDLLVGGFLLTGVSLWIGIVIIFRGQKRWINKTYYHQYDDLAKPIGGAYVNHNAASGTVVNPYGADGGGYNNSPTAAPGTEMGNVNDPLLNVNGGDNNIQSPNYTPPSKQHPPASSDNNL